MRHPSNDSNPPVSPEFDLRGGVVNLGLERFADTLRAMGVPVVHAQWEPPAGGDERVARILDELVE